MHCFAQFGDTYQSSEIYKKNNVKSRVMMYDYNRYRTRVVDNFDRYGMVIEHIEYDTTGLKLRFRSKLEYDSTDRLISETDYNYYHFDSTKQRSILSTVPDTVRVKLEYDDKNRIVRKTKTNAAGIKYFEVVYGFDPLMETNKSYNKDTTILDMTLYYDVLYIEKKSLSTFHYANGKTKSWNYTYKNNFDRSGKIKRRIISGEFYPENPDTPNIYFREQEYQYSSTGLLIKRLSSNRSDNTAWLFALVFDYKFW